MSENRPPSAWRLNAGACILLLLGLAGCFPVPPATTPPAADGPPQSKGQPPSSSIPPAAPMPEVKTVRLAALPVDQPIYVTWDQIVTLNQEPQPTEVTYSTVQDNSHFGKPQWTLIKFRNGLYVRGYRVKENDNIDARWFISTSIENVANCQSQTLPLQKLKTLTGPPEVMDDGSDYETVWLPEDDL